MLSAVRWWNCCSGCLHMLFRHWGVVISYVNPSKLLADAWRNLRLTWKLPTPRHAPSALTSPSLDPSWDATECHCLASRHGNSLTHLNEEHTTSHPEFACSFIRACHDWHFCALMTETGLVELTWVNVITRVMKIAPYQTQEWSELVPCIALLLPCKNVIETGNFWLYCIHLRPKLTL